MDTLRRRLDEITQPIRRSQGQAPAPPPAAARSLCEVVGGQRAYCRGIPYWKLSVPFSTICATTDHLVRALAGPLACEVSRAEVLAVDPQRTLVIDIETGGFSGTPVFLIGVVALDRRPLCVEQWLAGDYPEEEAILNRLAGWARRRDTWVTFNGKAFDAPFALDRAAVHRVELPPPQIHVDLLHAARRRWRGKLPDFRLETLERDVLGRTRIGDVPSSDVPDLFHHFFRTRNAGPLAPVLEHNQLDLVSSTELLVHTAHPDGVR